MLHFFRNPRFARPTALVLLASLSFLSFRMPALADVNVPAGTSIPLELTQPITSKFMAPGQTVDFRVRYDVKVNDVVVIPAGSLARGQVTRAQKAKGIGKEGYVEIQIKSVTAADGQEIPLTSSTLYREGEDKQTLSIVLGVLVCLLFLTMKGKEAEVPMGTTVDAATAVNTQVKVG